MKKLETILGINKSQPLEKRLNTLKHWCLDNISHDLVYEGDDLYCYKQYLNLTIAFLEKFLPPLEINLSLEISDFGNMNPIQYAAYKGYDSFLSKIRKKLKPGLLNKATATGMTPLHLAAVSGHLHTAQLLANLNAKLSSKNKSKEIPLHSTLLMPIRYDKKLKENKIALFHWLMKKDPELVNSVDATGNTIIHLIAKQGFDDCIKEIVDQYPNMSSAANHYKQYPIHLSILNQQFKSFKILSRMKDAAYLTDSEQRTCLHYAALFANESYLALCLEAGANLEALDANQMTPLLLAAQKGNFLNVKYLIHSGANIEAKDGKRCSLVHFAVLSENIELITWLLDDLKIEVNIEDEFKHTPFFYLRQQEKIFSRNKPLETLLLNHGAL